MTDTFIQESADNTDQNTDGDLQTGDQPTAGDQGAPDTHSPEYQLQVMQQRLHDKDEFINTLKQENQTTREMYASLEERLQNLSQIEEVLNKQGQQQDVGNQDTGLDEDALVGKVIENLNSRQAEERMQSNYQSVVQRMETEFGRQHIEEKVAEAAQANGLSVDDMRETARKSPQAFYKLLGLEVNQQQRPATPTPMRGSAQPPQETGEKDAAYYARLMRENPREYWKPETQREFRKLFTQPKK